MWAAAGRPAKRISLFAPQALNLLYHLGVVTEANPINDTPLLNLEQDA